MKIEADLVCSFQVLRPE